MEHPQEVIDLDFSIKIVQKKTGQRKLKKQYDQRFLKVRNLYFPHFLILTLPQAGEKGDFMVSINGKSNFSYGCKDTDQKNQIEYRM